MLIATRKQRSVTRYLGGLTAVQNPQIHTVIWARKLARSIHAELRELTAMGIPPSEFVSLATDPVERVRQQLEKSRIKSHFLIHDIALLVTVFGEISRANRIHVCLGIRDEDNGGVTPPRGDGDLILVCAYTGGGFRPSGSQGNRIRRDVGGHVSVLRSNRSDAEENYSKPPSAPGLYLHLEAAPKTITRYRK